MVSVWNKTTGKYDDASTGQLEDLVRSFPAKQHEPDPAQTKAINMEDGNLPTKDRR